MLPASYLGLIVLLVALVSWWWLRRCANTPAGDDLEVTKDGRAGQRGSHAGAWGLLGRASPARGGLTRRSFVGLGAALGVAVGLFGRVGARAVARVGARVAAPAPVSPVASATRARHILPVSSGANVSPGSSVRIVSRMQGIGLRPDRLIIGDSEDWVVQDIVIGGASQLAAGAPEGVPGALFGQNAMMSVSFATIRQSQDVSVVARYVGTAVGGAPFRGAFLGEAVA